MTLLAEPTSIAQLPDELSARHLLSRGQAIAGTAVLAVFAAGVAARLIIGIGPSFTQMGQIAVAAVTVVYCAVIAFKLAMVFNAWGSPVIRFQDGDLRLIPDEALPVYTVLVPLHREGAVLPSLVDRLAHLDYPAERLQSCF